MDNNVMMSQTSDVIHLLSQASGSAPPWYFSNEVVGGVAGAAVSAVITFILTRWATRRPLEQRNILLHRHVETLTLERDKARDGLKTVKAEKVALQQVANKYDAVRTKLAASRVIRSYEQPVLLLGPRSVGKTSLLRQWHAPWDSSKLSPATQRHKDSTVPVHDVVKPDAVPHFADPEILTEVHAHLKLRVHDFPGELGAQSMVIRIAHSETMNLRQEIKQNLGVVLICMFDAVEAATGIASETKHYYNGELFAGLRKLVWERSVDIQRIIMVFNKFDLLREQLPDLSHNDLLKLCASKFEGIIEPLHGAVNPEKVCEAAAVLDRGNLVTSQGATVVLGEAARGLVEAVVDADEVKRLLGNSDQVTYYSADGFPHPALP